MLIIAFLSTSVRWLRRPSLPGRGRVGYESNTGQTWIMQKTQVVIDYHLESIMAGNRLPVVIDYGSLPVNFFPFSMFLPRFSSDLHSNAIHFIPELKDLLLLCLSIIWGVLVGQASESVVTFSMAFSVWVLPLFSLLSIHSEIACSLFSCKIGAHFCCSLLNFLHIS